MIRFSLLSLNSSWLYIADTKKNGIYRYNANTGEELDIISDLQCPDSLSIDYSTRELYWLDRCNFQMETSKIDGSNHAILRTAGTNQFSYGASVYDSHIYYLQNHGNFAHVDCYNRKLDENHRIYSMNDLLLHDIQFVSEDLQPSSEYNK